MNKKLLLSLFALVGVSVCLSAADEARLLRFPATNGNEIVFSYAGDLYRVPVTGGEAQRLTSHVGYEMFPRFSPDGKTIAFTGQYDGNTEVYTIPAAGGEPQRLTYTATNSRDDLGDRMGPNNIVMTWTPDGKQIIYRNRISDGFSGQQTDQPGKVFDTGTTQSGRLKAFLGNKTGSDQHVQFFFLHDLKHLFEKARIMLSVSIYLYSVIISMIAGIFITGLYGTTDSKIDRKINIVEMVFLTDFFCSIF